MKRVASAGVTFMGVRAADASILARARASGSPSPMSRAPARSASYSRLRVTAIWMRPAAIGARINETMVPMAPMGLLSRRSPPPNIAPHKKILLRKVIPMAIAAATEPMRMSRLPTWLSSWASTPRNSSHDRTSRIPDVTATAACSGLRPVAKALAWRSGVTYSFGMGRPA